MDTQVLPSTLKIQCILEIPDSQDIPTRTSRASTQSWDSRIGPWPSESLTADLDSQFDILYTPNQYVPAITRSDRI